MRVISRRQFRRLGDPSNEPPTQAPSVDQDASDDDQVSLQVKPAAAVAGVGLWVIAGVLTHIAVRVVDRWLFK